MLSGEYKNYYGEIQEYDSNTNQVELILGTDTSVSIVEGESTRLSIGMDQVKVLDAGLNSPFWVDSILNLKEYMANSKH